MEANKPNALFICNEKFLDTNAQEGGVKFCTEEYISLIQLQFCLFNFPVSYSKSLSYSIRKKIGFGGYFDYNVKSYKQELEIIIKKNIITHIFLNLTNTVTFAPIIKSIDSKIKIILCSHGNESGDYLHEINLHKKQNFFNKALSTFTLGQMLTKEADYRKYIDLVLTVSDVEVGIEKWLGANAIYMVPRNIDCNNLPYFPQQGKVGFFGDLSHEPNFFGVKNLCDCLIKIIPPNFQLHLVGNGKDRGLQLQNNYHFVKYIGYLSEADLKLELSSWTFSLNPVFYYSRGVSTKLGKSLGLGLPVITTDKGMRGYIWADGTLPTCTTAPQMAALIVALCNDSTAQQFYVNELQKIQKSAPTKEQIISEIIELL